MAADVLKFVTGPSSSPTTRLDVSSETKWFVRQFDAPPPPLRRSLSVNAMTDGGYVSSSSYEPRTLTLVLDVVGSSMDDASTEFQKLARELDRETNYLMYQPVGATSPVFFSTYRSSPDAVEWWAISSVARRVQVTILAEPFAVGPAESAFSNSVGLGAPNGAALDLSTIKGDVPAPLSVTIGTAPYGGFLAISQSPPTSWWFEAESATAGTDTGAAAADAAMSPATGNTYRRTTFATTSMATRLTISNAMSAGAYRCYAIIRRTDNTSVINVKRASAFTDDPGGASVATPLTSSRAIVDLGMFYVSPPSGYSPIGTFSIPIQAERVSGTGNIDWDAILLVPADDAFIIWSGATNGTGSIALNAYYDVVGQTITAAPGYKLISSVGGLPRVSAGSTPRLYWHAWTASTYTTPSFATSFQFDAVYLPCYLHVRPAST